MWPLATWLLATPILALAGQATRPVTPCAPQVVQQRTAWRVAATPRRQPPGIDGGTVVHWPTDALGVWVVETHDAAGDTAALRRVAASGVTEVVWSTTCQPTTTEHPRRPLSGSHFTDADLQQLLDTNARGLLYLWSPHMPLSVEGVATMRAVGARLGLPVTVLLDPNADHTAATAVIAAHGWPPAHGRRIDSTELLFRDVLVHAPSLQAYAGGQLVGSPYPGFHTMDEYLAFLDRVLAKAR